MVFTHDGSVVSPAQAEETCEEVLGRLEHTVLRRCAGDNLAAVVWVQVAVLDLMQRTRVEQLLLANRDQDLSTELVLPAIQKVQLASEVSIAGHTCRVVLNLACQRGRSRASGGITRAMAGQHVQPDDRGILWQLSKVKNRRVSVLS